MMTIFDFSIRAPCDPEQAFANLTPRGCSLQPSCLHHQQQSFKWVGIFLASLLSNFCWILCVVIHNYFRLLIWTCFRQLDQMNLPKPWVFSWVLSFIAWVFTLLPGFWGFFASFSSFYLSFVLVLTNTVENMDFCVH